MSLFKNIYKTESNRLKNWDYSSEAIYFITIVTKNRKCIFGVIDSDMMVLNQKGKIIENELLKSIVIRDRWFFHNWVIMPNHIHLLIEIKLNPSNLETHNVETHCSASLLPLSRKPNSISSFVAVFKSVTTKQINKLNENENGESIWQPNYHDHIVSNYNSLDRIYQYIKDNPKNRKIDSINS